jgi:Tfp pilus assembly protein PilZ
VSAPDFTERRKHPRFPVDECEVTVHRAGFMSRMGFGRENVGRELLDLSEGGARVRTWSRLNVGTKVRVRIKLLRFSDEIEAGGEIRWCVEHKLRNGDFSAGVMFTKIDPEHARKIANMRNWFTSPQFRHKKHQKELTKKRDFLDLIE